MGDLKEDSATKSVGGIASVVPQLFYDLIARLVPGLCFTILYTVTATGPQRAPSVAKAFLAADIGAAKALFLLLAGGMGCYTLSILLWQHYSIPEEIAKKFSKTDEVREKIDAGARKRTSFKYDYIKHVDPMAGSRITKLSAEIHMTEVFCVGFTCLLPVALLLSFEQIARYLGVPVDSTRLWILVACVFGIPGSLLSRSYFRSRSRAAIRNCYEICQGPGTLKDGTLMYVEEASACADTVTDTTDQTEMGQISVEPRAEADG